ncbi:MAG: helicase-associated domain-containing protein [Thermomicrobiales bacterium]
MKSPISWAARDVWGSPSPHPPAHRPGDGARSGPSGRSGGTRGPGRCPGRRHRPEALRDLYRQGIVAVEQAANDDDSSPRLYLPREIGSVFERLAEEQSSPPDLSRSLDELLATVPYVDVEEAANLWGARVMPGVHARAELINIIRGRLERPDQVSAGMERLPEIVRQLWRRLRDAGGSIPYDAAREATGLSTTAFRGAVRDLGSRLLVWHAYGPSDDGHARYLRIPDGILHPQVPEPEPTPEIARFESDEVYEPGWMFPQAAAWDLLTILRDATRDAPRSSALLGGDPAIQRRLGRRLWRADMETGGLPTGYMPFLARVGALLGVLQDYDGRTIPGPESETWRNAAFSTAARRMVAAWTSAEEWIEGRDRIDLAMYGASWPAFRGTLLRAIADIGDDAWNDEESFVEYLIATEPDLLRQAQVGSTPSSQLPMRVGNRQRPSDRRADVLRLVIATTIETACVWLGIVERSQHIEGRRAVFRVTPFGRWVGGRGPEPSAQHLGPSPLAVGANLQILLYRPTPRRLWALSAFAESACTDRVSTYLLTSSAVIRALASNVEIADIVNFLERQSGQQLPQTVRYTLEEWDSGYHRVWMQRAVILTPEDTEDRDRIIDVLDEVGLSAQSLPDGTIALVHDVSDATERIFDQAMRVLRDRGFAPLARAPERRGS